MHSWWLCIFFFSVCTNVVEDDNWQNVIDGFGINKVEEQAAELKKDLIVKELKTLDVLEELGATKRIVEELKQQLQKEV